MFKKKSADSYQDAKNWYKDKFEHVRQQRDLLTAITLLSLLFSTAAAFTVMWLTPYKSVEPYVLQVEDKTGIVKRVNPITRNEFSANEAIDRFFIAQYIRAREGFMPGIQSINRDIVRVMSNEFAFRSYLRASSPSSPESAAAILKGNGTRTVKFKNMAAITRNKANAGKMADDKVWQARVLITDQGPRFPDPMEYHSVVTMTFKYDNLRLTEEERYINPLGFFVVDYEIDREVIQ